MLSSIPTGENPLFNIFSINIFSNEESFIRHSNDGGGGERVLWVAVKQLTLLKKEERDPVRVIVYSGDRDATPVEILKKARDRFGIAIDPVDVDFVFLSSRSLIEARYYPILTMIGQSLGSMMLALEAAWRFQPDFFIDSMGFSFSFPIFKYFVGAKVGAYVHYPTISTDMLSKEKSKGLSLSLSRICLTSRESLSNLSHLSLTSLE